jgi:hypothetical protein
MVSFSQNIKLPLHFVLAYMGVLPNSTKLERYDMIEVGCLTPTKEEAAYDGETPVCS